jgi:hypothetical protein
MRTESFRTQNLAGWGVACVTVLTAAALGGCSATVEDAGSASEAVLAPATPLPSERSPDWTGTFNVTSTGGIDTIKVTCLYRNPLPGGYNWVTEDVLATIGEQTLSCDASAYTGDTFIHAEVTLNGAGTYSYTSGNTQGHGACPTSVTVTENATFTVSFF